MGGVLIIGLALALFAVVVWRDWPRRDPFDQDVA